MIVSVNSASGMRYKLRQNFKSDITLQFNDQDDYSLIIGNTKKLYPAEIYGRGLVKLDGIYEFQTAHVFEDEEFNDKIALVIQELNNKYQVKATTIPVVPDVVLVDDLKEYLRDIKGVPLGINKDTINTELFNFKDNYVTLVSSNDSDVFPDFVRSLTKMISNIDNDNVVLLDSYKTINGDYNKVTYVDDNFSEVVKKLCDSMDFQYKKYVEDNYSIKNLKDARHVTVIMGGFSKILMMLDDDLKKQFFELLMQVKDIENFSYIFVDSVDNLKQHEYNDWYKKAVQNTYGIWIGSGVADQTLIKTNIGFKKINNEIPDGFGVIIKNSKTSLVKLISDGKVTVKSEDDL